MEGLGANVTITEAAHYTIILVKSLYFDHSKKEVGHDQVWAVGPLFPDPNKEEMFHRGGTSSLPLSN